MARQAPPTTEAVFAKGRCGLQGFNGVGHLPSELTSAM
jgi:hypothetical protein